MNNFGIQKKGNPYATLNMYYGCSSFSNARGMLFV